MAWAAAIGGHAANRAAVSLLALALVLAATDAQAPSTCHGTTGLSNFEDPIPNVRLAYSANYKVVPAHPRLYAPPPKACPRLLSARATNAGVTAPPSAPEPAPAPAPPCPRPAKLTPRLRRHATMPGPIIVLLPRSRTISRTLSRSALVGASPKLQQSACPSSSDHREGEVPSGATCGRLPAQWG